MAETRTHTPILFWLRSLFVAIVLGSAGFFLGSLWDSGVLSQIRFNTGYLLLAGLLLTLHNYWMGFLSRNIVDYSARVPFHDFLMVNFISHLGRYIPGKVWMIIAKVSLLKRYGHSKSWLVLASAAEIALAWVSALFVFGVLVGLDPPVASGPSVILSARICLGAGLALFMGLFWAKSVWKVSIRLFSGYTRYIDPDSPPPSFPYSGSTLPLIFVGMMATWLIQGFAFGCIAMAVNTQLEWSPFLIAIYPAAWAMGFVAFVVPSGLGVREGFIVLGLSILMPATMAIVIALAARVVSTFVELLINLFYVKPFLTMKTVETG